MKNQLSNTESALEASKKENESLSNEIVAISKREDNMKNQIDSNSHKHNSAVKKLEKITKENEAAKQQIQLLKTQINVFEEKHKAVCRDLQSEKEKNIKLNADILELKKQLILSKMELESYLSSIKNLNANREVLLESNRKDIQIKQESHMESHKVKEKSEFNNSCKQELEDVIIYYIIFRRCLKEIRRQTI